MGNPGSRPDTDLEPVFLTVEDVIRIHKDQIERYGGASEIGDIGLLESAVAQPQIGLGDQYLHETLFHMAAAYLCHITMNHPFVDGNKRVGVMAAYVFLALNGYELGAEEGELEDLAGRTAHGQVEKQELAGFLEKRSHRIAG